jgi:hypothetical protein
MAVFNCPNCGHSQAVEDTHLGKKATCPRCKTQGVVTNLSVEPRVPDAEAVNEPGVRQKSGYALGFYWSELPPFFTNKESSLQQQWLIIDEPRMAVRFVDVCGVVPTWIAERTYAYTVSHSWQAGAISIAAVEFRFLTFNVWGEHVRTLVSSCIKDIGPRGVLNDTAQWSLFSEAEGMEHFASIGYVARVRTADGKVLNADTNFLLREAQRFTEKFSEEDLEPKTPKKE